MKKLPLPILALALIGAGEPVIEPQNKELEASAEQSSPFLKPMPLRSELYNISAHLNIPSWSSLGGQGTFHDRKAVLLSKLAAANPRTRQKARWDYARFLISEDLPIEGVAVLTAMKEDEDLLNENPTFRAAYGIGLIKAGRLQQGLDALAAPQLLSFPEACLWRSYAHANLNNAKASMLSWSCAAEALGKRSDLDIINMALPIVRAAHIAGDHHIGAIILKRMPRDNHEAIYWRGIYALNNGELDLAQKHLTFVRDNNERLMGHRAELALVQALHKANKIKTKDAIERLDKLRFSWRGGFFEKDLLKTLSAYHEAEGHIRNALAATATRVRYLDLGDQTSQEITRAHYLMGLALSEEADLSLSKQAGIYWDYRDLAPQGLSGDNIIRQLADRIADEGLHSRAADLLERQIDRRLVDADSTVAAKVAMWRLIAGEPQKALDILEQTDRGVLATDLRQRRQLLTIYSLLALHRGDEAVALIDQNAEKLPDRLRAELYWQGKEYPKYVRLNSRLIAASSGAEKQDRLAMIIRQAIAANISGNTAEVERIANQYQSEFTPPNTPYASAYALLTGDEPIGPEGIEKAMADVEKAAPTNAILGWITALSATKSPTSNL